MDEFKKFLKVAAVALVCFFTVVASAGSIDFGTADPEPLYRLAGILNLGWLYFPIREIARYFKARNAQKTSAKGGVVPEKPQADNKTDEVKTNI